MKTAKKTIRKTIAFPSSVLAILNKKAVNLGISTIDFIRYLALKEAEKEFTENNFTKEEEQEILNELKNGENFTMNEVFPEFTK